MRSETLLVALRIGAASRGPSGAAARGTAAAAARSPSRRVRGTGELAEVQDGEAVPAVIHRILDNVGCVLPKN